MTGLRKVWKFWVRECNYAWGRISTLTTPVRKRYQLDTCYLLNSDEHAFIHLFLNKMICAIYYILQDYLNDNLLPWEIGLRWPLSRGSQFKLHFLLGMTGKPKIAPKCPRHLFSKDCQLIIPNYGTFQQRAKCIAMLLWFENKG